MKHTLFMVGLLVATVPATLVNPFVGLAVYYGLATLCPQFLWKQALPEWRWSMIVGLATVVSFVGHGFARSRAGARWPIEKKLMLAFGGLIVLSMVDAVEPNLAWQQFDNIMKIFIMFFIACAVLDSRHRLSVLAVVVVAALGWVAFDFNQRYILMGQKAVASTGFAGIDNNGIAAIMVMGIPFCVLLFSQAK
ncbi:MAG: hypothetical protein HQ546_11885, partial [Planctomycetes bacterium]|nr:hypothetical protein [Planctomycetota bacterium]